MKGFTLIEVLLVLALLCLSSFLILGSYQAFLIKKQIDSLEMRLNNMMQFSRNTALEIGHDVTLTPTDPSGNWSKGIVLFEDNDRHQYTGQEKILQHWLFEYSSSIQLQWSGFQSKKYIVFSSNLRHSIANGHFDILNHGVPVRQLIVNRLGTTRMRSQYHASI